MKFSRIRVTAQRYMIGTNSVADPVVHYAGKRLRCDDRLPVSLSRLVPVGWGHVPNEAWKPFIERAIVLNLL